MPSQVKPCGKVYDGVYSLLFYHKHSSFPTFPFLSLSLPLPLNMVEEVDNGLDNVESDEVRVEIRHSAEELELLELRIHEAFRLVRVFELGLNVLPEAVLEGEDHCVLRFLYCFEKKKIDVVVGGGCGGSGGDGAVGPGCWRW